MATLRRLYRRGFGSPATVSLSSSSSVVVVVVDILGFLAAGSRSSTGGGGVVEEEREGFWGSMNLVFVFVKE